MMTWSRTAGFLADKRFVDAYVRNHDASHLQYYHWQIHTVCWAAGSCLGIAGDFVELGVFKGFTTAVAAEYLDFKSVAKRWYLYDTFTGIPEDQLNAGWTDSYKELMPATAYEDVQRRFADYRNIQVIKGKVPDILDEISPERTAFMHVDLNSAVAERAALERLFDRLSTGGMIVFDDYGWTAALQQKLAADEFMAAHGHAVLELPTGQGLVVKHA